MKNARELRKLDEKRERQNVREKEKDGNGVKCRRRER
jgi:hypothetical protein